MPKRALRLLLSAGLFLLTACGGSLDQAARLQAISDQLHPVLTEVSGDLYGSCQRRLAMRARVDESALTETDRFTKQNCEDYHTLSLAVAADANVLLDYLNRLGKLANNGTVQFSKSLDADKTLIGDLSAGSKADTAVFTDAQKAGGAAVQILHKLAALGTAHVRARQIQALVISTDPAVQNLTHALDDIMTTDYGAMLTAEKNYLHNYYAALDAPAADGTAVQPLLRILVQRQYDGDAARLAAHRADGEAYGQVMLDIGALHAQLATAAAGPAFTSKLQSLNPALDKLQNDTAALVAAVK